MDLKKDLIEIMDELDEAFVSEGDFQFTLANKLQKKFGNDSIIVEYPICNKYIDIAVINNKTKEISFIELKYNTKEDIIKRNGIIYIFKSTGTHIVDFICDIIKLESLKKSVNEELKKINFENKKNYCILLTNNNSELKTDQKIKNTEYICKWKKCNKIKTQTNKINFKYLLIEVK